MSTLPVGKGKSPTKELSKFAVKCTYDDLPKDVIKETKRLILDTIGCGLAGYQTEIGQICLELAKTLGGPSESTIIGSGYRSSCVIAAYANSKISNALDLEGTDAGGHPGPSTLYPALALAEREKATGKDIITAVAVGYDIAVRIASSWKPKEPVYQKASCSGFCAPVFGAVTAAGKILGLNEEQMLHAFGIAGAYAPISSRRKWPVPPGSWLKYVDPGWMAVGGTIAAFLAKLGHNGYTTILDGDTGFWRMVDPEGTYIPGVIMSDLGEKWYIKNHAYKFFPCCHWFQTALHILSKIIQKEKITPEEIEKIKITTNPNMVYISCHVNRDPCKPETLPGAQFSVPYCTALVVLGIPPGPAWFDPKVMNDPKVHEIASKVEVEVEPMMLWPYERGWTAGRAEVIARGQRFVEYSEYLKGDCSRPETYMTDEELKGKIKGILKNIVPNDQIEELIKTIDALEEIEDITLLTRLFSVQKQ